MSTDTDQRIIVELRLHDPQENDTIHDFYCDEPPRFAECFSAAVADYLAANNVTLEEADEHYLYAALADMFDRGYPDGLRMHLADHGITPVEDQPERLVVTVDYYTTMGEAVDVSVYE